MYLFRKIITRQTHTIMTMMTMTMTMIEVALEDGPECGTHTY